MRFSHNHLIMEIVSNFFLMIIFLNIGYSDVQWSIVDFFSIDAEN